MGRAYGCGLRCLGRRASTKPRCAMISVVDEPAAPLEGDELDELQRGVYQRGTDEFARVLTFSDGVFAIAMTLLVAGIEVPGGPGSLAERVQDEWAQIWSFFLSFVVIGYYWFAHHRMFAMFQRLRSAT
ncbi:hypothetical protein B7486_65925, partial [cyanobacterium TDX16]